MALSADIVVDRRRLKRRLTLWRVAFVVALLGVLILAGRLAMPNYGFPFGQDHVARISLEGVIYEDRAMLDSIREIATDGSAKALVVYIDSPGGTVVGGEAIYTAIREVAEEKPVAAVMGTTAASGGYMVALGADRIFAHSGTITGSIGVILQTAQARGLLEKLGLEVESIKSDPLKAVPNPFEPLTEEAREVTQRLIDDMYELFLSMVIERRELDEARARILADGRVYTGRQAVENGLVDSLGGDGSAFDWLSDEHEISRDLPLIDRTPGEDEDLAGALVSALTGKGLLSERLILDGLLALWHPELR